MNPVESSNRPIDSHLRLRYLAGRRPIRLVCLEDCLQLPDEGHWLGEEAAGEVADEADEAMIGKP